MSLQHFSCNSANQEQHKRHTRRGSIDDQVCQPPKDVFAALLVNWGLDDVWDEDEALYDQTKQVEKQGVLQGRRRV